MTWSGPARALILSAGALSLVPAPAWPHTGPPFPIVHREHAGPYEISLWTDPDATDDGTPGGQFWVMIRRLDGGSLPENTRASVSIRPLGREGPPRAGTAEPVRGNLSRQFVALLMDHEGRFDVQATVSGRSGEATVSAEVDATYDLRPPPFTLVLYAMPFVAIGFFWLKILRQRRIKLAARPRR